MANLYTTLDDARTWADARSVPLQISFAPDGGLLIKASKPGATEQDPSEDASWSVSFSELKAGFDIDPLPLLGQPPSAGLGAQLRFTLYSPIGPQGLSLMLADANHEVTKAVVAEAAAVRARPPEPVVEAPPVEPPPNPLANFFQARVPSVPTKTLAELLRSRS